MVKDFNHMARPTLFTRTLEDSIVLMLFDIANELGKLGDGVSSRAGLTTQQWLMLLQIAGDPNFAMPKDSPSRNGAAVMASEIARARGVSRANVSTLVTQLMRMGLVSQTEQSDDRRRKHLAVTDAGRRALAAIESARHEANQNLLASLSPTERRQLQRALRACLERLWLVDRSGGVGHAPLQSNRRRSQRARRTSPGE
jgi:DNA-binding MarR family transcriptional regulator